MTKRKFVIVVDIQQDFMLAQGKLPVGGAESIIPDIREYLEDLSPKDIEGVLFTLDTHSESTYPGSAEAAQFPPHCYRDTDGWQLVVPMEIIPNGIPVYSLEKGVFSMWADDVEIRAQRLNDAPMERDAFFQGLRSTVDTIIVLGVAADFCIKWTVDGALARGFQVEIPQALTKGIAAEMPEVVLRDFSEAPVRVI